jgi:ATP-dependent RNA helicase DeaD
MPDGAAGRVERASCLLSKRGGKLEACSTFVVGSWFHFCGSKLEACSTFSRRFLEKKRMRRPARRSLGTGGRASLDVEFHAVQSERLSKASLTTDSSECDTVPRNRAQIPHTMTTKRFDELGLSEPILKAIAQLGYEQPAPIQVEAIPLILAGHDILGQSQTGSGKTAAFGMPAVEMCDAAIRAPQVLILCPTRELAVQVAEECFKYAAFKRGVRSVPIYGGQSYERQFKALEQGPQIIIGTPGRVLDHIDRGTLVLDGIRLVVLDEADRMLDMGFREDIESVLGSVSKERQLICFSATMAKPILSLIEGHTRDLKIVKIQHKTLSLPSIEQTYYEIRGRTKTETLTRLIDLHDIKLGVVFCNTKRMVDEVADELVARGYSADRIHGDMTQAQRDRVMNSFRASRIEFLVATDVAARGIDVEAIEVVFNYDLPWDEEDYIHRIGRTGRAGRAGLAISLVAGREIYKMQAIERFIKAKVQRRQPPSIEEIEEKRSNVFFERMRQTLQGGDFAGESAFVDRLLEQGFSSTDIACAALHELRKAVGTPDDTKPKQPEKRESREDGGATDRPRYAKNRDDERFSRPPDGKRFWKEKVKKRKK